MGAGWGISALSLAPHCQALKPRIAIGPVGEQRGEDKALEPSAHPPVFPSTASPHGHGCIGAPAPF
eukprot:60418-Alexandrium_andersonii.AAC.1